MSYQKQTREWDYYSMEAIPKGLYRDNNTGQGFASTRLLSQLMDEFEAAIDEFIKSDSVLEGAVKNALFKTALGLRRVRLHPESTIRAVVKEFQPKIFADLEGCGIDEFLERLARFTNTSIDEPKKRNWQPYPTKSIPEGLYLDTNTGDVLVSADLLANFAGESSAVQKLIHSVLHTA
jgi:hypothetical protein